ncbi:MAG: ERAP1-like C-terminal domain-containing protein, partial [Desulfatiglandales bacterium]
HTTAVLRDQLLWHAVLYGSERAAHFAGLGFSRLLNGEKAHPDIMRSLMQAGAFFGGEEVFKWLTGRFEDSQSEHERMNILIALGCFKEPAILGEVQGYILSRVPDRNKSLAVGVLAENVFAIPQMWEWYLGNRERFETFHPVHHERVLAAIIPYAGLGREDEVRSFFREYMKRNDKAREVIKLSLERLEIHSGMARAFNL